MTHFRNFAIASLTVMLMGIGIMHAFAGEDKKAAAPAADKSKIVNAVIEKGWATRCPNKANDKKDCEAFDLLQVKSSSARVAEFAIGFPEDKTLKEGMARGVIILPLGIYLPAGASMKIDDGSPLSFNSRFCNMQGCFSYVNLSKDILVTMKKAKSLTIFFKTYTLQDAHITMTMDGFGKALKDIQ